MARPPGSKLTGGSIPAGQKQVQVTLTAPPTELAEPVSLSLQGSAMIQGQMQVRKAVPAEDMMQAFAYRHLVPARELEVAVLKRPPPRATMTILSGSPVRVPPGATARIEVGLPGSADCGAGAVRSEQSTGWNHDPERIAGYRRRGDCVANGRRQGQTRPQREPDHQRLRPRARRKPTRPSRRQTTTSGCHWAPCRPSPSKSFRRRAGILPVSEIKPSMAGLVTSAMHDTFSAAKERKTRKEFQPRMNMDE